MLLLTMILHIYIRYCLWTFVLHWDWLYVPIVCERVIICWIYNRIHNKKKNKQIIVEQYYRNIFPNKHTRFYNAFVSRYIHRRYIRIVKQHYSNLKETHLIGIFVIILPDSALLELYGSLILRWTPNCYILPFHADTYGHKVGCFVEFPQWWK